MSIPLAPSANSSQSEIIPWSCGQRRFLRRFQAPKRTPMLRRPVDPIQTLRRPTNLPRPAARRCPRWDRNAFAAMKPPGAVLPERRTAASNAWPRFRLRLARPAILHGHAVEPPLIERPWTRLRRPLSSVDRELLPIPPRKSQRPSAVAAHPHRRLAIVDLDIADLPAETPPAMPSRPARIDRLTQPPPRGLPVQDRFHGAAGGFWRRDLAGNLDWTPRSRRRGSFRHGRRRIHAAAIRLCVNS